MTIQITIYTSYCNTNNTLHNNNTKIGMPQSYEFVDIYGLDLDLLTMVSDSSSSIAAVILLFPCSNALYKARRLEERQLQTKSNNAIKPHDGAFFIVQHSEFGNACGSIACLHAITNAKFIDKDDNRTPINRFCYENTNSTPSERGRALLQSEELKMSSDNQANSTAAQTTCPSRNGPDLDHHFVTFSYINGRLVELDGTKLCAIDHGPSPEDPQGFLQCAANVIQKNFMQIDPTNIEFSLMALREQS